MAQGLMELVAKPEGRKFRSLGPTQWKEETSSHKLSSDCHRHLVAMSHPAPQNK